jgi:DNA repair exonuclease SbcCD nuclease subunit
MIRILFLADTHLGFDYPFRPRVQRRRRGPDFFRNFELALQPAHRGEVDLVVHGGDIFYRSKIPARLVEMAFEPLKKVADMGIPVYVVPGNHERSSIPYHILAAHPNIFVFDQPKCFRQQINGLTISLAGFPFLRHGIRDKFKRIVERTGCKEIQADMHVLCMHQSVDGATMGPKNFMFRGGADVIDIREIPAGFAAVLTGHMHRHQVLQKDLRGKRVATPVLYAGAVERTSFAEKDETKGYMIVDIEDNSSVHWRFYKLPARPMAMLEIDVTGMAVTSLASWLDENLRSVPDNSLVKMTIRGKLSADMYKLIRAESLRQRAPESINISVRLTDYLTVVPKPHA